MGANRSENSSYTAAIKKIKSAKRKEVVNRVHPLKNCTQPRSKAEVEPSAAKLVSSSQPKKLSSQEKHLPASEFETVEASPTSRAASTKASHASSSDASHTFSLPESRDSSSERLQLVIPVVVEDLGSKAVRNKRLHTSSSSPPPSPIYVEHFSKKVGKSLEDLSASRLSLSKSPSSSKKKKINK